jgi:hypothetical protein
MCSKNFCDTERRCGCASYHTNNALLSPVNMPHTVLTRMKEFLLCYVNLVITSVDLKLSNMGKYDTVGLKMVAHPPRTRMHVCASRAHTHTQWKSFLLPHTSQCYKAITLLSIQKSYEYLHLRARAHTYTHWKSFLLPHTSQCYKAIPLLSIQNSYTSILTPRAQPLSDTDIW